MLSISPALNNQPVFAPLSDMKISVWVEGQILSLTLVVSDIVIPNEFIVYLVKLLYKRPVVLRRLTFVSHWTTSNP